MFKKYSPYLVILLTAYIAFLQWPRSEEVVNVFYETPFENAPKGVVGFQSFNAKTGKDFKAGAKVVTQTSGGTLVLPISASKDNPVPAVVILHGSGGDWSGRSVNLALKLAEHGIAGLAVDTFVARNLRPTDDYFKRLEKAPIFTQMADGLSALQALQKHPFIQGDKIAVTGMSLGAGSSLYMMFETVIEEVLGKQGPRFSAYAMFYGGCSVDFEDYRVEGSPLLIMMGGEDASMSIDGCKAFQKGLQDKGVDVDLVVYPTAGHGWDNPYPQAFKEGAAITKDCVMKWMKSGDNIELNSGYSVDNTFGAIMAFSKCSNQDGYIMGFNHQAYEQSWLDFYSFLQKTWAL